MFEYSTEKQLKDYLIANFNDHFNFGFIEAERHIVKCGYVDILGKDDEAIYIVEVKRDQVTTATIKQIQKYIDAFQSTKKVIGIAAAPSISDDIDWANIPENIFI